MHIKESIYAYLKAENYKKGSKSWRDYDSAKVKFQNEENYFQICQWIVSYFKI